MHKSLVPKLFIVVSLFISLPAKAEDAEIINPDWQAVPGTKPTAEIGGELGELSESTEPAFVNVCKIARTSAGDSQLTSASNSHELRQVILNQLRQVILN